MGDSLRYSVLLAAVIVLLASVFVTGIAVGDSAVGGATRANDFTVSINGTNIKMDPVTDEKTDSISPNTPNPYSVKVHNTQPFNIDFKLDALNVPANWTLVFADSGTTTLTITVTANSQKIVNMIVSSTVFGVYNMTVQAVAVTPPGQTLSDNLILTCKEDPITITPDSSKKFAGAGKGVKYELNIKNNYDQQWDVDLGLSAGMQASDTPLANDWAFKFDQSIFVIPNLATVIKNLTVFAPINATPNDEKVFLVQGEVTGDNRVYYSVEIKCIVKEVYNLSISIDPPTIKADPGDRLNYTITVVNNADNADDVKVEVTGIPDFWVVEFSGSFDKTTENFKIAAHQTKKVFVTVTVYPLAQAGLNYVSLNITGKGGPEPYKIVTDVNETHSVQLGYTDEVVVLEENKNQVYPVTLDTNTFRIKLKNNGNIKETAKIKINDVKSGWLVHFAGVESGESVSNTTMANPSDPIDINAKGVRFSFNQDVTELTLNIFRFFDVYLIVSVQAPDGAAAAVHSFSLSVEYGQQQFIPNFIVNMTLSISNMELVSLRALNTSGRAKEFEVVIQNNYPLETTNFDVVLYVDFDRSKEIDKVHVDSIQPGANKTLTLIWKDPDSGLYYIDAEIKGETITNSPDKQIQIVVKESDDDNTLFYVLLVIILLLILAVIIGTIVYAKRKAETSATDKEAEEYDSLYGDGRKKRGSKDEDKVDKETADYLHGEKYKSRKSKGTLDADFEDLYGDKQKKKKGGGRKGRKDNQDDDEEDAPKGRKRPGRRGRDEEEEPKKRGGKRPPRPRKGKPSKDEDL